jgi:hypothetical protein
MTGSQEDTIITKTNIKGKIKAILWSNGHKMVVDSFIKLDIKFWVNLSSLVYPGSFNTSGLLIYVRVHWINIIRFHAKSREDSNS